ncbi:MAG: DUF3822 family protein [Dysgonamonadaceae bacterium]|jgi:hypothetical protein|nr:DUF3822 family protein [Dysgonamonadaceae bacterium]
MFLPENIDLACSEKYILSIRLLPNGFSFCISSPTDPEVFCYKETAFGNRLSYAENVKKMVFDLGFLSQVFLKTEVVLVSDRFTLVPAPFFDAKKAKTVFDFNLHPEENEAVLYNILNDNDMALIFGINKDIYAFLLRSLWNPVFTHHVSHFIPAFLCFGDEKTTKRCHVDFQDSMITVVCMDARKLLSANVFEYDDASDGLFYIVSVWEKQGLDQMTDSLYLSGKTEKQKYSVEVLKKLIKNVQVMNLPLKATIPQEDAALVPTDLRMELCG